MLASLIETHALMKHSLSESSVSNVTFVEKTKREIEGAAAAPGQQRLEVRTEAVRRVGTPGPAVEEGRKDLRKEQIADHPDEEDTRSESTSNKISETEKKQFLLNQQEQLERELLSKMEDYRSLKVSVRSHEQEMASLKKKDESFQEKIAKSEEELEKHKKIVQLLPDAETNLSKLLKIVQKSKEKVLDLQGQWEEHKTGLDSEYEQTKRRIREIEEKSDDASKAKGPMLEDKMEKIKDEIKTKENLIRNLKKEFESLKDEGKPRKFYTNRILDLNSQIEKLRTGVDKVIEDVKTVQKDINNLNGKLERTFIEITITMENKINNKEPYIEQGLDITKKIHNVCNDIVQTIRSEIFFKLSIKLFSLTEKPELLGGK